MPIECLDVQFGHLKRELRRLEGLGSPPGLPAAKAWGWVVFHKPNVVMELVLWASMGGLAKSHKIYYREGRSPSHSHGALVVTKWGVPVGVACVGGFTIGTPKAP